MKYLSEIQAMKSIVAVEVLDLREGLDSVTDADAREKIIARLEKVEVYRLLYKVGKLRIVGFLVLPKTGENLPCLIHLRGGSRDFAMMTPRSIVGQMVNFASEGYVVIATQYPGVDGGEGADAMGGPDDLASVKKLRDILKQISCADYNNLGVKGHSRGGLMVYMLLREVKWIKVAMITGAPVDQVDRTGDRKGWREHQVSMWGKSRMESIKRSPIRWVEELPKRVPLLIMHGSSDWRVLPRHSFAMVQKLTELAIPNRFILFEGADHGISEYRVEYYQQTLNWFNRFLKNKEPLPNMKPHGD